MEIKNIIFKYPCAKQVIVAILINGDKQFVGTNWCINNIQECPRGNMPSGTGYELCKNICQQLYHAEEDALAQAGESAKGATLYLVGHYYMCSRCSKQVKEAGVKEVIIVDNLICKSNNWYIIDDELLISNKE